MKKVFLVTLLICFSFLPAFSQHFTIQPELPVLVKGADNVLLVLSADSVIIDSVYTKTAKGLNVASLNGKNAFISKAEELPLELRIFYRDAKGNHEERLTYSAEAMPAWFSVLPPLIAILLAILLKEVIISLFAGILTGTLLTAIYSSNEELTLGGAFFHTVSGYIIPTLNDTGHLSIIVFSLLIGGMVAIISKNGGMSGLVKLISKKATTAKRGQFATWFLGLLIFFDDYANTMVIGSTMRPVTDKLRISREKLAYIVDSTAAPVASIAFVTTWIGAQLGYITDGIEGIKGLNENAYSVFLNSLQYSFYPIFTLVFILMLIWTNRDFGPMYKVEKKRRLQDEVDVEESTHSGLKELDPEEGVKPKAFNALVPVVLLILCTIAGLIFTGYDANIWNDNSLPFLKKLSLIIGQADSYKALLWSSLLGLASAIILSSSQKIMSLEKSMEAMFKGFGFMLSAIVILTLAWALSAITANIHTAHFITQSLIDLEAQAAFLPAMAFIMAALVSFSTGSSWSTMAILYPILLPAAWLIGEQEGLLFEQNLQIFYNVVSCILAGSVLGDHCSPISDTTVLSSLATSCNHLNHVKTQLPYALTVGLVSILVGTIPAAFEIPVWILFFFGFIFLYLVIRFFGKTIPTNN